MFPRFLWLKKFIRRNMRPIHEEKAIVWKQRISLAYGFLAFNAFGMVLIACYQGKADWAKYYGLKSEEELAISPSKQWAATLGVQNAKFYRISGLKVIDLNEEESKKNTTEDTSFESE